MTSTERAEISFDSSLCLNLRNRKVRRTKTDPDLKIQSTPKNKNSYNKMAEPNVTETPPEDVISQEEGRFARQNPYGIATEVDDMEEKLRRLRRERDIMIEEQLNLANRTKQVANERAHYEALEKEYERRIRQAKGGTEEIYLSPPAEGQSRPTEEKDVADRPRKTPSAPDQRLLHRTIGPEQPKTVGFDDDSTTPDEETDNESLDEEVGDSVNRELEIRPMTKANGPAMMDAIQLDGTSDGRAAEPRRSTSRTSARRQRSLSGPRTTNSRDVVVPADLLMRTIAAGGPRAISDAAVAPKPFTGRAAQDPESWLEYFERYCEFRQLRTDDKRKLFAILLQEGAADWLSVLPPAIKASYSDLVEAFKTNYYKSPELKWKEAGALWNQAQGDEERVEDFVTRLRKAARRLNLPQEVLHYAVISGLRGPIRLHVVQQGVRTLDDTLRAAKVAEAAATTTTSDALSVLMLDAMKASAEAAQKQTAEIKQLATKVATLAVARTTAEATNDTTNVAPAFQRRPLLPTPQNQQRLNYAQRMTNRPDERPKSFTTGNQTTLQKCGRCGLPHRTGVCRAEGQECRHCGKTGHFARVCRSARVNKD